MLFEWIQDLSEAALRFDDKQERTIYSTLLADAYKNEGLKSTLDKTTPTDSTVIASIRRLLKGIDSCIEVSEGMPSAEEKLSKLYFQKELLEALLPSEISDEELVLLIERYESVADTLSPSAIRQNIVDEVANMNYILSPTQNKTLFNKIKTQLYKELK